MSAAPSNLMRSTMMPDAEGSPLFVTALAKGLSVLTAFGPSRPAMNLLELAEATGLNKSTIQRSVFTLEALGYLAREGGSKRYRLTVKSLEIGTGYLQTAELIERANPFVQQLNRQTPQTNATKSPNQQCCRCKRNRKCDFLPAIRRRFRACTGACAPCRSRFRAERVPSRHPGAGVTSTRACGPASPRNAVLPAPWRKRYAPCCRRCAPSRSISRSAERS